MADGIGTTGGVGAETAPDRILTIFAETIERFPLEQIDIFGYTQIFRRIGAPGNTQEVVYANFGNGLAQEVAETEDPTMSHADLSRKLITVKKYAERPAITEEMMEDGRYDEMQLALEHAGQKMVNRYVERFFDQLKTGPYSSTDIPEPFGQKTWAAAANHLYSADHDGNGLVAQSAAGHIYDTGDTVLYPGDISLAIRHIEEHGYVPDVLLLGPALLQQIRDIAGFTKDIVTTDLPNELQRLGRPAGRLMGLDVVVVSGGWLEDDEFIVAAKNARPVGYLTKRDLRLDQHGADEAIAGWDVRAVTLSARYGFSLLLKGAVVVASVTT